MAKEKTPIIVDVDTGCDDAMALMILAQHPDIDILAAVSTFGNAYTEDTTRNTLNILALVGREDIPVARGADYPWKKKIRTSPYIHGQNGVGEFVFPQNATKALTGEWAWDLCCRKIMECKKKVDYVALGSLTNLAVLLRKYPQVKERISRVIYMGGERRSSCAGSQTASVNIFHDPGPAGYVIAQNLPFYMCSGTDVTAHVGFTLREINQSFPTDSLKDRAIRAMMAFYFQACGSFGESVDELHYIHDATCIMYLLNPECYREVPCYCEVELDGPETYGYSQIDIHNIAGRPEKDFNIHYVSFIDDYADFIKKRIISLVQNKPEEKR